MKTLLKSILTASLLLITTIAPAQRIVQDIEDWMDANISRVTDAKIDVQKSLGQERDRLQDGAPLKWRCDTYTFTLPKKRRQLLDEMKKAFEANGHDNPNCYSINSLTETPDGDIYGHHRNLMIGDDVNRYVTIGKDYNNFLNINILDAADTTKTHRYAYALEWREARKGAVDVRYVVTYAKIPSATTSITSRDWPFLDLGTYKVKGGKIRTSGDIRVRWGDKEYTLDSLRTFLHKAEKRGQQVADSLRSVFRDVEKRSEQGRKELQKRFEDKNSRVIVTWSDTLDHDTDPVTDLIQRLQQGQNVTADDLLCNENILLIFSQLKQQFLAGQNTEFNAISIYSLCKRAREYGFFTNPLSKAELEQLKRDIIQMQNKSAGDTLQYYLQMALEQLEKIQPSYDAP